MLMQHDPINNIDFMGMSAVGADGLTNEQWIKASRPGNSGLADYYRKQNREQERNRNRISSFLMNLTADDLENSGWSGYYTLVDGELINYTIDEFSSDKGQLYKAMVRALYLEARYDCAVHEGMINKIKPKPQSPIVDLRKYINVKKEISGELEIPVTDAVTGKEYYTKALLKYKPKSNNNPTITKHEWNYYVAEYHAKSSFPGGWGVKFRNSNTFEVAYILFTDRRHMKAFKAKYYTTPYIRMKKQLMKLK